ncbi:unnamed protein product [Diabrotica balteata]|uniref:Cytochrome P450 n=1 Tax=Diabrotica balteata TaxID=107213 RepID=A0A9N9SUQ0_DIABA|nr:unnamed protein product [Diabrotica balteata]
MSDFNVCVKNITSKFPVILNDTFKNVPKISTKLGKKSSQNIVSRYLLILCGVIVLTWYLQMLWRRRRLYYYYYKTPGPLNLPFIGVGYKFLTRDLGVMLQRLVDVQIAYPKVAAVWFGPKLYFLVSKPEYVEKVLMNQSALNKDHLYKFLSNVVGEGLLSGRARIWKKHRRAIMPAFNQKILDAYQDIFWNKSEILVNVLEKEVGTKNIELFHFLSCCTLDIICETALGINMNTQTTNETEFAKALDKLMEITSLRTLHFWHQLTFTWKLYPISREFDKSLKIFDDFVSTVISNKLRDYSSKSTRRNSCFEDAVAPIVKASPGEAFAFLDLILENTKFSEQELLDEVKTFLAAGTDTTASTLCFVFTMLGLFQDVQQKVYEEFIDILGPDRRSFPDDLAKMKYTDRVIKETLRLFPVAPLIVRSLLQDIDGGDMVFPRESSVIIGIVFLHRNPAYWPDPLKFDPDRFLPENTAKRHPCAYIPFSYGPRNCIGGKYGMMNIKTILATVLRRYKIFTEYKSVEEIKVTTNLVLRLKDGPKVWIEPR